MAMNLRILYPSRAAGGRAPVVIVIVIAIVIEKPPQKKPAPAKCENRLLLS